MSIQPTGPAYQPRSRPSSAGISSSARSRGSPPTAGVGWSSSTSSIDERASDPARDDRLLLAVLLAVHQLLAEMRVDGRIGAAPARAGERDCLDALALAAHKQLRARAQERQLGRSDEVAVARREPVAQS